jgi:uncharacterized membrane protein YkoI
MSESLIIAIVVVGAVVLVGILWWFFSSSGSDTPKSADDIVRMLESQGYKVKEVELEDGAYEVEAYKGGKEYEIKLDRMGKILKVEEED